MFSCSFWVGFDSRISKPDLIGEENVAYIIHYEPSRVEIAYISLPLCSCLGLVREGETTRISCMIFLISDLHIVMLFNNLVRAASYFSNKSEFILQRVIRFGNSISVKLVEHYFRDIQWNITVNVAQVQLGSVSVRSTYSSTNEKLSVTVD